MYVVVEFERRECSIVPLSWLTEDNSKCYWPKAFVEERFINFVKNKREPRSTWSKYNVFKVYYTTASYEDAEIYLKKIVDQTNSTSSDGVSNPGLTIKELTKKRVRSDSEDTRSSSEESLPVDFVSKQCQGNACTPATSIEKIQESSFTRNDTPVNIHRSKNRIRPNPKYHESCFSGDARKSKKRKTNSRNSSTSTSSSVEDIVNHDKSYNENFRHDTSPLPSTSTSLAATITAGSAVGTDEHSPHAESISRGSALGEHIVRSLKTIEVAVHQNCLKIDSLLRMHQTTIAQSLSTPSNIPKFPIAKRHDMKEVENFLKKEENFQYLKCRLACVGGSNVRNCVMNMLKFLMTNKVAMKYNWAGRENKRPFKHLTIMHVISDATRQAFLRQNPSDLQDKTINDAVKDWLRLARARFDYSQRKVPA